MTTPAWMVTKLSPWSVEETVRRLSTVLDAKNQRTVVKRADVEELRSSELSLMPENVLTPLNNQEIRDLFAYLRSK